MIADGYRVSLCGDENVLKLTVVITARIWEYTGSHGTVQFKLANCVVCELHLNKSV